jgi:tetratricopeptide (TPR) repeat protein
MTGKRPILAGMFLLCALAWLAYLPGLRGGFLFDDFVNLDALGATGPVDNAATLARYLTSGTADPTGRPLALLSFLLDARDWPADPAPFLRTNLVVHFLNALLLFALLDSLGALLQPERPLRARAAALLAAGAWLLHPLLVSTTLYIVQRESMLVATCAFAALYAYVQARRRYARQPGRGPLLAMALAIGAGTGLALLCKANGAVLPLLALVLEATVLRRLGAVDERVRWLRRIVLVLPSLLLLAYLASFLPSSFLFLPERGWSIAQRLLSQPRALLSYLALFAAPRAYSSGLYNDSFAVSASPWQPWTTLPAFFAIVALAVLAWRSRQRQPAFAAGLLFFFAGHAVESTSIPIELYFEHRNYLPAALLAWPLALYIANLARPAAVRCAIAAVLLLALAALTWQRASVWSRPELLAKSWAVQNPRSSRAQATAAMFDTSGGRPRAAMARLAPIWRERPHDLQIAFNYANAACMAGGLSPADAAAIGRAIESARAVEGARLINGWLGNAIDLAANGQCPGLDLDMVAGWTESMARNPAFAPGSDRDQEVEPLRARIALREGQPDQALVHFDRALEASVTPDIAARQAALLASSGAYAQALAHLDHFQALQPRAASLRSGMPWLHARVLERQGYWPREFSILRGKLHAELARKPTGARQ